MDPLEYGWEESAQHGIGLVPVQGFDVVCPAIIQKDISCNCLKTNCVSCSCSKYGLKCTELCGCGELCENAPVLEDTGHSVESDIEEGEEDDLPMVATCALYALFKADALHALFRY